MTSQSAIRFIQSTSSISRFGCIHLQCHVKPGASKQREGILDISDVVELCVAAQAQEGEANRAVIKLISQVLNVPKSDVAVIKGFKSRMKMIAVAGIDAEGNETGCIEQIRRLLQQSTM